MRRLTSIELRRLSFFTQNGIEIVLIETTLTGLKKSILDATRAVREFLKGKNLHNYELQKSGPECKVNLRANLITPGGLIYSSVSLYRPITKNGDPRIWFTKLREISSPNDIIGIFEFDGQLNVVNLTRLDIEELLSGIYLNPLIEIVRTINNDSTLVAKELLGLMKKIAKTGLIKASALSDTEVGRTLEKLLGIPINSSKLPDYKGIEIKSSRSEKIVRNNLFAQVPDWDISKFKSSDEILNIFGYYRELNLKLYCTVSALKKNSQGLILRLEENLLFENSDRPDIDDFVVWRMEGLLRRLAEKHKETFWVKADSIKEDGYEYFKYNSVLHTRSPILNQFEILLAQGLITVDHLIKREPHSKAREKGPLFKIKRNAFNLLFPDAIEYNLLE